MESDGKPIPNSYWVEPGRLLAGEYPAGRTRQDTRVKIRRLLKAGVNFFLDLTEPGELRPYATTLYNEAAACGLAVKHKRLPIRDVGVPKTRQEMTDILDAVDRALRDGHLVYLHCWGGVGRTGTVVGCFLCRRGLSGDKAIERLGQLWRHCDKSRQMPRVPETPAQEALIRTWRG